MSEYINLDRALDEAVKRNGRVPKEAHAAEETVKHYAADAFVRPEWGHSPDYAKQLVEEGHRITQHRHQKTGVKVPIVPDDVPEGRWFFSD